MAPDPLSARWLKPRLHPARLVLYPCVKSTNEAAVKLLNQHDLTPPSVVVTSRQTAGKGQHRNRWWSDQGSLCVSFVLPTQTGANAQQLPLRCALAVVSALSRHMPSQRLSVKWPNDVLVHGRKIAGILCQRLGKADVIGMGINVHTNLDKAPPDVRERATCMSQHGNHPPRRREVLVDVWQALNEELQQDTWHHRYEACHALKDKVLTLEADGEVCSGRCMGVDQDGRLMVQAGSEMRRLLNAVVLQFEQVP